MSDAATNPAAEVVRTITITNPPAQDTQAPTVTITNPTNNSTISGTITINATATDNVGVSQVEFFDGTNSLGVDTTAPYSITLDTTTLTNNSTRSLSATATDTSTNDGFSSLVSVTIDNTPPNTPPSLQTTLPSNTLNLTLGDTFNPASDVTTTITATDTEDNDTTLTSAIALSPSSDTVPTNNSNITTQAGTYTLRYDVTDSGGLSATQLAITVNVATAPQSDTDNIDNTLENNAPGNGDYNNDGTADANQNNVATRPNTAADNSFISATSSNPDRYTSLSSNDTNGTNEPGDITSFTIQTEDSLATQDSDNNYPLGLFNYRLENITPGSTKEITIVLDQQYDPSNWTWRKYNATTNTYTDLPASANPQYQTINIDGNTVTTFTYNVTDGGALDEDGLANGVIIDPVGPSLSTEDIAEGGNSTGDQDTLAQTGLNITHIVLIGIALAALAGGSVAIGGLKEARYRRN